MKKLTAMVGTVLAVVLVLSLALPVMASDTPQTVNTEAVVGGGDAPPYICAKFETPDDNSSTTDTVELIPEPPAPPLPPAEGPNDGWKPIKFYVVLGDTNGVDDIAAVDVSVFYPDGTLKFQVRAVSDGATVRTWTATGGPTTPPAPYNWGPPAPTVRQLTFDNVNNDWDDGLVDMDGDCTPETTVPDALAAYGTRVKYGPNPNIAGNPDFTMEQVIDDIKANKQIMLELVTYMWFHQDACTYKVVAQGTDMSGSTTNPGLENFFDYVSIVSLYIDFSTGINWGAINIGEVNYKYGDRDITTPGLPTVWNNGNDPAQLKVSATKAYLWEGEPPVMRPEKWIDAFDCHLDRKHPSTGAILQEGTVVFTSADGAVLIVDGNGYPVLLPSCEPQQIDFSIHPPIGTKAGTYKGTITLTIEHYTGPPIDHPNE
jgi:hypothetical protein